MLREYLMPSRCRTISWKLFNILIIATSFTGIISISISRGHYLIDILLAYYVTTRVFWIYHTLANNYSLRVSRSATCIEVTPSSFNQTSTQSNYLSRVWWWHLFRYFESIPHERRVTSRDSSPKQTKPLEYCSCDSGVQTVKRAFEWPLPWPRCLRRANRYRQRLLPTAAA